MRGEAARSGTFRALREPNFRDYLVGQAISQGGTWMQLTALSVLVLRLTDSGFAVSLVNVAQFGPVLVLGAWAGALSDRLDRQRVLVGTAVAGLVSAAALATVVLADLDSIAVVLGITLVAGLVVALENPVRRAFVSELVGPDDLSNAVGLNAAVLTGSKVVGPALAGALIAGPGLEWCFLANALTFAPQIVLFARLDRTRFEPSVRVARERGQIRAGLAYVLRRPYLRAALLMTGLASMAYQNMAILLPVFTERELDAGPVAFSVLFSLMSVGMIGGSLVVARADAVDIPWIRWRSLALWVVLVLLAFAPTTPIAGAVAVLVGAAYVEVSVAANALLQMRIEGDVRGRVLGLLSVVTIGTSPCAAPVLGLVADWAGARVAVALAGLIAGTGGLLATGTAWRAQVRAGPAAWEPEP